MQIAVLPETDNTRVPHNTEAVLAELPGHSDTVSSRSSNAVCGRPHSDDAAESLSIDGYTILDRIGGGGMGQVYRAVHRRMGRAVAIKTLRASAKNDPAAIARFEREFRAAAMLEHPNIVTAFDAGESQGIQFLVMQYVEGLDLATLVKEQGPLSAGDAILHLLQAARGLEFAHWKGLVHRDIKPANLLLDKYGVIKILDLGLARIEGEADIATQAELTISGTVMGTVDYMAPEQALSTKNADARADIYSLGCTLFYLLTGKPAFEGESLTARLIAHQIEPAPELRQHCPQASAELEAVFSKMVAKKREDRYQSMSEVIADLLRLSGAFALAS